MNGLVDNRDLRLGTNKPHIAMDLSGLSPNCFRKTFRTRSLPVANRTLYQIELQAHESKGKRIGKHKAQLRVIVTSKMYLRVSFLQQFSLIERLIEKIKRR